jgi:hypothetical protein
LKNKEDNMAKKEFKSEVVEHIAILKEGERYQKEVLRMIWNDNPITVDIRSVDKQNNFVGKGISLSDEECDKLVDILLDRGYGSIDKIKEVLVKNMRRTNTEIKSFEDCEESIDCVYIDDEGYTVVDVPLYD